MMLDDAWTLLAQENEKCIRNFFLIGSHNCEGGRIIDGQQGAGQIVSWLKGVTKTCIVAHAPNLKFSSAKFSSESLCLHKKWYIRPLKAAIAGQPQSSRLHAGRIAACFMIEARHVVQRAAAADR